MRILLVIADPNDLPRFPAEQVARDLTEALQPIAARSALVVERLAPPTEAALKRATLASSWDVLHMVVHAQARAAARYGTLALESSSRSARNLTAAYFAELVSGGAKPRVVVLQACDEPSFCFEPVVEALLDKGVFAVICSRPLGGNAQRVFTSKLYLGLLAAQTPDALTVELRAAVGDRASVFSRSPSQSVFASIAAPEPQVEEKPAPARQPDRPAWQRELQRKRASCEFDVFLCHNRADKPAVLRVGQKLKEAGLLPWLDVWELPPGQPWQPLLEQQMANIKSAAVFVGSAGLGPWQEQEVYAFLREFVDRRVPVIPVLLEDAPDKPELPIFLKAMTWVDFRLTDPDPLQCLIWGITGQRPED